MRKKVWYNTHSYPRVGASPLSNYYRKALKMAGSIKGVSHAVYEAIAPTVTGLGYEIWDIEFVKEGASYYLRIYIDKAEGIDIDDCEKVHRAIDPVLDEADPIDRAYYLEVSSPGLGRQINNAEQAAKVMGQKVEARFFAPDKNGRKAVIGTLAAYDDTEAVIDLGSEELKLEIKTIAKLCLYDYDI